MKRALISVTHKKDIICLVRHHYTFQGVKLCFFIRSLCVLEFCYEMVIIKWLHLAPLRLRETIRDKFIAFAE